MASRASIVAVMTAIVTTPMAAAWLARIDHQLGRENASGGESRPRGRIARTKTTTMTKTIRALPSLLRRERPVVLRRGPG